MILQLIDIFPYIDIIFVNLWFTNKRSSMSFNLITNNWGHLDSDLYHGSLS